MSWRLLPCRGSRRSRVLQGEVLERRGVGKAGDLSERSLADPGADAVEEGEFPERCEDRLLVDEKLHLFEDRGPLLRIELLGLLRVECVDVGIAAVDVGAVLDDEGSQSGRGIAKGTARPAQYPMGVFLVA